MPSLAARESLAPYQLQLDGAVIDVRFLRKVNARRLIVRLDGAGAGVVVTVPPKVSRAQVIDFVERSKIWIAAQRMKTSAVAAIGVGSEFPFKGEVYKIQATGKLRGLIEVDSGAKLIHVAGEGKHINRRLVDFLKQQARQDLTQASQHYAKAMHTDFGKITVRDQKSRWGSCSSEGDLSFNWRLILAPAFVLDYVAAHEVAHRLEMNHGPQFWQHVYAHCAATDSARRWLKRQGPSLQRIVF